MDLYCSCLCGLQQQVHSKQRAIQHPEKEKEYTATRARAREKYTWEHGVFLPRAQR